MEIWTWWIPDKKSGGQMDDFGAVFLHFLGSIFDVASRTAAAGRETYNFHLFALIAFECTLSLAHSPEAFASRAGVISPADDNPDFDLFEHFRAPAKESNGPRCNP